MGVSPASTPGRSRAVAEETRRLILQAAEIEFADHGFATARLEDIAGRVDITRTAIIYHFGDKRALYDAVLAAIFGELTARTTLALDGPGTQGERVERLVDAWIETASTRPTLARLFMREVANAHARGELGPSLRALVEPMFARVIQGVEAGQRAGEFRAVDPHHVVSILAGATMWYATNDPLLGSVPLDPEERSRSLAAYRRELLGVARHLLGAPDGTNVPRGAEVTR